MHFSTILCLALVAAAAAQYTEEEDVLVLTKDNFDQAVSDFKYLLVEFYAPWCGHCKALAPEYAKAARILKEEGSEIRLAKVDATVEKELAERYSVSGFPTIKLLRGADKEPAEFTAGRMAEDFVTWLKKKTGPPAQTVDSIDAAKLLISTNEVVVFGFFKEDAADDAAEKLFLQLAEETDDVPFAVTTSADVFAEYKVSEPHVVIFKQFDEGRADLKYDAVTDESLRAFLSKNRLPIVVEFTQESAQKIFGGDQKLHLLLFVNKTKSDAQTLIDTLKEAAPKYHGKVLFIFLDINDDDNLRVLEFFGLKPEDCPTLRLILLAEELVKYRPLSLDLSVSGIQKFVQDYLDGKLKPHLMSESVPADWDSKPVKVLVGENFHKVAMDKSTDVIVEFYAPWCGHCKQLAPIWDELGEKYKDRSDIVVAKMDATTNELEDVKIQSFPTIKFFPKKSDEVIDYKGDRTFDALVQFVDSGGQVQQESEESGEDEQPMDEEEEGESEMQEDAHTEL